MQTAVGLLTLVTILMLRLLYFFRKLVNIHTFLSSWDNIVPYYLKDKNLQFVISRANYTDKESVCLRDFPKNTQSNSRQDSHQ